MGFSGDSYLSGFVAFGYCFALVSVVMWTWPSLTVRNTSLQIPTAAVSQSEQHFWAGIQWFFCALSPCFRFCIRDLWTEGQLTLSRPKHEFTAFWMIWIYCLLNDFFFLFFFYCPCLITVQNDEIRCTVCSPPRSLFCTDLLNWITLKHKTLKWK